MKRHLLRPIAKAKKFTPRNLKNVDPLPVCSLETAPNEQRVVAVFTGLTVEVCDPIGIEKLALGGCFGQGTLSRSFPASVRNRGVRKGCSDEQIVRQRQLDRREEWRRKFGSPAGRSVLVMEEDVEKQLADGVIVQKQLKYALVKKEVDPFPVPENLSLFFEECMFLVRELKCLEVRTLDGVVMSENLLLETFSKLKRTFLVSYVAYVYLKSKNWVIKSGLKFGGDFLLYQKGPQFFHATYIVLIQPYQNCSPVPGLAQSMDNFDFQCFNRIAETTAKSLLLLEVHFPPDVDPSGNQVSSFARLSDFKVSEVSPMHYNYAAYRNDRTSHQQSASTSCK